MTEKIKEAWFYYTEEDVLTRMKVEVEELNGLETLVYANDMAFYVNEKDLELI